MRQKKEDQQTKIKKLVAKENLVYQDYPTTLRASTLIVDKWQRYPFVLADLKTGAGKTFIAINAVAQVDPNAMLFVITMKKQVDELNWEKSIYAYNQAKKTHLDCVVLNYEKLYYQRAWQNDDPEYRKLQQKIEKIDDDTVKDLMLENFPKQKTVKYPKKELLAPLNQAKKAGKKIFLILDECHKAKNTKSATFKSIKKLQAKCVRTLGLSATPLGNHAIDLCSYFVLNQAVTGIKNESQFKRQFSALGDDQYHNMREKRTKKDGIDWNTTFKDVNYLKKTYHDFSLSLNLSDILPPTNRKTLSNVLTPKEEQMYLQLIQDYQDGVFESNSEFRNTVMRFLGACPSKYQCLLKQVLQHPKRPQTPTVIFYTYTDTFTFLKKNLIKDGFEVFAINGKMKAADKHKMEKLKRLTDPNLIILAQYQAGGTGLNIPNAHTAVLYEATTSYIQYQQSLGRNRRAYQTEQIHQIRLINYLTGKRKAKINSMESEMYHNIIDQALKFNNKLEIELINKTIADSRN